jgi:hypothetical protein
MGRGRRQFVPETVLVSDSTGWILDNNFAEFVLMHTNEIRYMCMFGYCFLHGKWVFRIFSQALHLVIASKRFLSLKDAASLKGFPQPLRCRTNLSQ